MADQWLLLTDGWIDACGIEVSVVQRKSFRGNGMKFVWVGFRLEFWK